MKLVAKTLLVLIGMLGSVAFMVGGVVATLSIISDRWSLWWLFLAVPSMTFMATILIGCAAIIANSQMGIDEGE